jgi:DNA polymerase-1
MRLAIIDGDEAAYKGCTGTSKEVDWGDGQPTTLGTSAQAVQAANDLINTWRDKVGADRVKVALSCRDRNLFRRELYPAYKSARTEKPEHFWTVVDALERTYETVEFPALEADDVIGMFMTRPTKDTVIGVTSDKDLRGVPGRLYSPYHDAKRVTSPAAADYFWMTQTLTGDPVDGFIGLRGVGPAKAAVLLEGGFTLPDLWAAVKGAFIARGQTEDDALLQARLARILRHGDYDVKAKKVVLWAPPETT